MPGAIAGSHTTPLKMVLLPPSTTSLLQNMNQEVIAPFKAYHLISIFAHAIRATEKKGGPTVKEFWKGFNIGHAVKTISEPCNKVKPSNLKLCLERTVFRVCLASKALQTLC